MLNYKALDSLVRARDFDHSAAEIHGLITGWLCAGAAWDNAGRVTALSEWLDVELENREVAMFEEIYDGTRTELTDDEFGFSVMLPDDEQPVDDRTREVARWCSGFLSGFGMTGKYQDSDLGAEVSEVMADLGRIAGLSEEVPEDDANEADLIEIIEYVKMSAILVHAECGGRTLH